MSPDPAVVVLIACRDAAATLPAAVRSAVRQRDLDVRVIVVDHGSDDATADVSQALAVRFSAVQGLRLESRARDRRTPARPLNQALGVALSSLAAGRRESTWLLRLDADDVLAHDEAIACHLRAGGYRPCIMAPLVFFDSRARIAHWWGPRLDRRSWHGLASRDLFTVAHHATAVRADLAWAVTRSGPLFNETVDTGEDLAATARLYREVGRTRQLGWSGAPVTYKALAGDTISNSLAQRRVWTSWNKLRREYGLPVGPFFRGAAELALSRVVAEPQARTFLQRYTTRNGHFADFPYGVVEQRLAELAMDA